jgi:hypothetical protein
MTATRQPTFVAAGGTIDYAVRCAHVERPFA